ncbi:MAG: hypothetical protein ACUVTY_02305 [Armatimonadota bacterium]
MGCSGSSGSRRAFRTRLYSAINPLTDALPYLPGGTTAEAFAINDRSQVVGYSNPRVGTSTVTRPTLWQGSTVSDLISREATPLAPSALTGWDRWWGTRTCRTTPPCTPSCGGMECFVTQRPPARWLWLGAERSTRHQRLWQITGYGAHNGITRAFVLSPVPTTVTISLDGYTVDYSVLPLQVEVRSATTGETLLTLSPTLSATGQFSLMLTPATYHLAFKADRSYAGC